MYLGKNSHSFPRPDFTITCVCQGGGGPVRKVDGLDEGKLDEGGPFFVTV